MFWGWVILSILLATFSEAEEVGQASQETLTEAERQSLSGAKDAPARIKVYLEAAGHRLNRAAEQAKKDNYEGMEGELRDYIEILKACQPEAKQVPEKKRKDLKNQEITLRRYLSRLQDIQGKLGYAGRERVEGAIEASQKLRSALLSSFFGPDTLKHPRENN